MISLLIARLYLKKVQMKHAKWRLRGPRYRNTPRGFGRILFLIKNNDNEAFSRCLSYSDLFEIEIRPREIRKISCPQLWIKFEYCLW